MATTLTSQQKGCLTKITEQLNILPDSDQALVLREVKEQLEDQRAKRVHEAILEGKMETSPSTGIMSNLKAKYDL